MADILFYERQQFRQKWMMVVYALMVCLFLFFVYADIQQIVFGKPVGSKPAPGFVLVILTLLVLLLIVLFYFIRLDTKVDAAGIHYKWKPFMKRFKTIAWEDIREVKIIRYGFVGYGWRLTQFGTIINVGGDMGLQVVYHSGRRFVLGTQKPAELTEVLKQLNKMQ